jgi:hypothetical protein
MTKLFALFCCVFALNGCSQIEALSVSEGDNAFACLKGESSATAGVFGGSVSGITVEVPGTVDTSQWSVDDWIALAEVCD